MRCIRTAALTALALTAAACGSDGASGNSEQEDAFRAERLLMVRNQIERRGIRDEAVLRAVQTVPREQFVPASERSRAYSDRPLPIGEGQTISQPYIVALMSSLAGITPGQRVLEIGTGSGYQAAVLAELEAEVWSIELLPGIAARAETTLRALGLRRDQPPGGRRLPRLAGSRTLRPHRGHRGAAGDSAGAPRSARPGWTAGRTRRTGSLESAVGGGYSRHRRGDRHPGPRGRGLRADGAREALAAISRTRFRGADRAAGPESAPG